MTSIPCLPYEEHVFDGYGIAREPRLSNCYFVKHPVNFVNDIGPHRKPREIQRRPIWHWPEQLLGYVISVAFLTVTGPFETYAMPFVSRIAYWGAAIGTGFVAIPALAFAMRYFPVTRVWPPLWRTLAAFALAVPLIVSAVLLLGGIFRQTGLAQVGKQTPVWLVFVNVGVVALLIGGILVSRLRPRLAPPVSGRNPFLDVLPPQLGTALISLTAQDHHVEVVTAKGRDLLHMRLSGAVEMLGDYPGQRSHRSHWIFRQVRSP